MSKAKVWRNEWARWVWAAACTTAEAFLLSSAPQRTIFFCPGNTACGAGLRGRFQRKGCTEPWHSFCRHPDVERGGLIPRGKGRVAQVLAEGDEEPEGSAETWTTLAAEPWGIHNQQWLRGASQAAEVQPAVHPSSPLTTSTIYFGCWPSPQFTHKIYHQKLVTQTEH